MQLSQSCTPLPRGDFQRSHSLTLPYPLRATSSCGSPSRSLLTELEKSRGAVIQSDISARQNSPPWIRRGGAGGSQHGVVGTRSGHTTPATAYGHGIPSTEEGSI